MNDSCLIVHKIQCLKVNHGDQTQDSNMRIYISYINTKKKKSKEKSRALTYRHRFNGKVLSLNISVI